MPGPVPASALQAAGPWIVAAALAVAAAVLVGWLWRLRLLARRAVHRRAPQLRHPVVLAHGFLASTRWWSPE